MIRRFGERSGVRVGVRVFARSDALSTGRLDTETAGGAAGDWVDDSVGVGGKSFLCGAPVPHLAGYTRT